MEMNMLQSVRRCFACHEGLCNVPPCAGILLTFKTTKRIKNAYPLYLSYCPSKNKSLLFLWLSQAAPRDSLGNNATRNAAVLTTDTATVCMEPACVIQDYMAASAT